MLYCVITVLYLWGYYKFTRFTIKKIADDWDEGCIVFVILSGVIGIILLTFLTVTIEEYVINAIFNPEYFALNKILKLIGK